MAFIKKPVSILFLSGSGVGVAGASGGFGKSQTSSSEINEPPKDTEFRQKLETINDFLKIGDTTTQHSDLMKDYSLTLSGAKDFARLLVGSLIVDMVDHLPSSQASVIQRNIKGKIDSVRLNSIPEGDEEKKNEIYKLYGGEDRYKFHHVFKNIRKIIIDELVAYLPQVLSQSTEDLKGTNHGDDMVKNGLGTFYDFLLDDYLKYNKPLFLKRFAFAYTDEDISDKVKKVFESSNLPSNFQYPKKAGYLFPYLKNKTKWETLKSETDISTVTPTEDKSDDHQRGKMVVPLSIIDDPNQTSNFIMAVLKLHDSSSSSSSSSSDKLSNVNILDENSTNTSTIDDLKSLEKSTVFFRDKNYVQVLVKDTTKDTTKDTDIKKWIIEAAKNDKEGEYKFDLKSELQKWMEKHLERLFLEKWSDIKDKQSEIKTQIETWTDVASKLKDVLAVSFVRDSLVKLRKGILRDYSDLVSQFPPLEWNGQVQENPMLKFAGKFAQKPYFESDKKLGDDVLVFGDLETNFLNERGKTTTLDLYNKKYDEVYKDYKSKVTSLTTSKASELSTNKEEGEKTLYSFQSTSQSSNENTKSLDTTNLFNNLWINMVYEGRAETYFLQKQTHDYLKEKFKDNSSGSSNGDKNPHETSNLLTSDAFKSNAVLKKIEKSLFQQDSTQQDFSEVLFRRYLISKATTALRSVPDPSIYVQDLMSQISSLKDGGKFKDVVKKLHDTYGEGGHDLMSPWQKTVLAEMTTMEFLAKDDFNNLRKLLKHKFRKDGSAAFLFTKKYEANGLCSLDPSAVDTAMDLEYTKVLEFKNELLGHDKPSTAWSPKKCLTKDEFFDFAILKADSDFSNVTVKAGFRGLVFSDQYAEYVAPEIAEQLKKIPIWGKAETIVEIAKEIKTENALKTLLGVLKTSFPDVSWSFVEEKHWINPRGGYGGSGTAELSLQERKNILVGFLSQSTEPVKENSSLEWKYSKQKEWAKGTTDSASNSFLSSKLTRVSGLFESGGSKILRDSEGNSHLVHLIHVRYDDLKDMTSWKSFLKDIGPDLLAHELVKLAGDRTLQNQVIYHLLNETKANEGISKLTIGDSRLREKMGVMWLAK